MAMILLTRTGGRPTDSGLTSIIGVGIRAWKAVASMTLQWLLTAALLIAYLMSIMLQLTNMCLLIAAVVCIRTWFIDLVRPGLFIWHRQAFIGSGFRAI